MIPQGLLRLGGGGVSARRLRKAARQVRRQVVRGAAARGRRRAWRRVLRVLAGVLRRAGRVNRRKKRPATYQTLLDPAHDGLS